MLVLPVIAQVPRAIDTPYAQKAVREIRAVHLEQSSVPVYECLDISLDLTATFQNPFDPEDVAVDATVRPPSGKSYVVPGFFDQTRPIGNGKSMPRWRLRIAPKVEGEHEVVVRLKDRTGSSTQSFRFTATAAKSPGFIGISPRDHRYFEFSNGKSYFPIGSNLAWSREGVGLYERWIPELGKVNANFARIWLSPPWTTFGLEVAGKSSDGKGVGQYDLTKAADLDHVLEMATRHGVAVSLLLDSFNVLRPTDREPYWAQSPYNSDNGGPLRIWSDFWTDEQMRKLYRMKLRYLAARYGAYRSVFSWELWNEVDQTGDFEPSRTRDWIVWAAGALREVDSYQHLISTSVSPTMGIRDIDQIPELDYIQTHHYGSQNPATVVAAQQSRKGSWGRAQLVTEVGASSAGPMAEADPTGIQIRDPMWASLVTGGAGAAVPWWWDSYIDKNNLYPLFGAMAKFVSDVDFPGEQFQVVKPALSFAPGVRPPRRDLKLDGKAGIWGPHNLNKPRTYVYADGKMSSLAVSKIQHGLGMHPDWHNPILFRLYLPRATKFEVEVDRVSGYGGATLRIELDGSRYLTRDFTDPDGLSDTHDLTKDAGIYAVTVPKGYHTLKVENVGMDWFSADYRFIGLLPPNNKPATEALAMIGNDVVLSWVRPADATWQRIALFDHAPDPVPPCIMRMNGLASGRWAVEQWDTDRGVMVREMSALVDIDGVMRVSLPALTRNIALKIVRRTKTW